MPQERLPKQTLYAEVSGKRPVGRLRTRWFNYIEDRGWNRLALNPSEIQSVLVDQKKWRLIWSRCPRKPLGKRVNKK